MRLIYSLGIWVYNLLLRLAAPVHNKARKLYTGRKELWLKIAAEIDPGRRYSWFHFASLGEFEQGRPVLEAYKKNYPEKAIIITFFSPSGYEVRKNYQLADHVFYLPADTPKDAGRFIKLINPEIAIFTKYEYWYYFFRELHKQQIPLYIISAIFRPKQVFFRWYGSFFRETLSFVTHFFVQDQESLRLLNNIRLNKVSLAGDTRFDRVLKLAENKREIEQAASFSKNSKIMVAGSTWLADEQNLAVLHREFPDWKLIIAPHEITEIHLIALKNLFPKSILFSELIPGQVLDRSRTVLIIDNIGMLSSLYGYAHIAYIGGGFGAGIHNTLEAAAYGIPVIFGPRYHKFREARDLIEAGAGFTYDHELVPVFNKLQPEDFRRKAGAHAADYVKQQAGATNTILDFIIKSIPSQSPI